MQTIHQDYCQNHSFLENKTQLSILQQIITYPLQFSAPKQTYIKPITGF